jgi:hypothetical protein
VSPNSVGSDRVPDILHMLIKYPLD